MLEATQRADDLKDRHGGGIIRTDSQSAKSGLVWKEEVNAPSPLHGEESRAFLLGQAPGSSDQRSQGGTMSYSIWTG